MPQLLNYYWSQAPLIKPVAAVIMLCMWHVCPSEWLHQHAAHHEMSGTNLCACCMVHHCLSEWLHQHVAHHEMSGTNLSGCWMVHHCLSEWLHKHTAHYKMSGTNLCVCCMVHHCPLNDIIIMFHIIRCQGPTWVFVEWFIIQVGIFFLWWFQTFHPTPNGVANNSAVSRYL